MQTWFYKRIGYILLEKSFDNIYIFSNVKKFMFDIFKLKLIIKK